MTLDRTQLRTALATAVVVPVTPFAPDGSIDTSAYTRVATRMLDGGISVLTPNGNTGEFYALNPAEARQVLETAAKAADGRAAILAGVGHDIATAIDAAKHARDHGAHMVMIHQPVHPYISTAGWIDQEHPPIMPRVRHRKDAAAVAVDQVVEREGLQASLSGVVRSDASAPTPTPSRRSELDGFRSKRPEP